MSPERVVQGRIARIDVINPGEGYVNPSVVISPEKVFAEATVVENTGAIGSVEVTTEAIFHSTPSARISSGEGADLRPRFSRKFGRIESVAINSRGRYYKDTPTLKVIDKSGKGKGALLKCDVVDGHIAVVRVINSGIDYDPDHTEISVIPVGTGAEISAVVEYYDINRFIEVASNPNWAFDDGYGFVYRPPLGVDRKYFGYVCSPEMLREQLGDDGTKHSPILGFAFDGNPIYGPYGYVNNTDHREGIERQLSAYIRRQSRNNILPGGGGNKPGLSPPSQGDYPMGYFCQDYRYAPDIIHDILDPDRPKNGYIATEQIFDEYVHTELSQFIEVDDGDGIDLIIELPNRILDRNNGKICNTPEYPKELYPDGVYCYFVTIDDQGIPAFPYIIGENFNNRPISQRMDIVSQVSISPLPRQNIYSSQIVDDTNLVFDFDRVERLRNPYLQATNQEIQLKIGETSEGSVDEVFVQVPRPAETAVGDYVYFDNTGTAGAGAQALISFVEGKEVQRARITNIETEITSHHLVLRIDDDPTLVETTKIYVGSSINEVLEYGEDDQQIGRARVLTLTQNLPTVGQFSFDSKGMMFRVNEVLPIDETEEQTVLWVDDTTHFKRGDTVKIKTGYDYPAGDTHENAILTALHAKGKISVKRGPEAREIPDETMLMLTGKYMLTITTTGDHGMSLNDRVKIHGSQYEEVNGIHKIVEVTDDTFSVYMSELYDMSGEYLTYTTSSYNVIAPPSEVSVLAPGYGYHTLPKIKGSFHRVIDRAELEIEQTGSHIDSIKVLKGGSRYVNPVAHIVDIQGYGSGAEATVTVSNGSVIGVTITNKGANYKEPQVFLVEEAGKYICTTQDIGKIKSFRILNPGRNISADKSLKPEILIDTRCVVKYHKGSIITNYILDVGQPSDLDTLQLGVKAPIDSILHINRTEDVVKNIEELVVPKYREGELLYQGLVTNVISHGTVIDYDDDRQIVTLDKVYGFIDTDEKLIGDNLKSDVLCEGQADCRIEVNGSAKPEGKFIDDTSKVSESYAVIQDSYRYQWFSYVISSPIQQIDYAAFVQDIIHPAGFIQFGDLTIRTAVLANVKPGYVKDDPLVIIIPTPCAPLVLLDSFGTPILASTVHGHKYILVYPDVCIKGKCDVILLTSDGTPILASTEEGYKYIINHERACIPGLEIESCYLQLELAEFKALQITDDDGTAYLLDIPCIDLDDEECAIGVTHLKEEQGLLLDTDWGERMLGTECREFHIIDNHNPVSLNI